MPTSRPITASQGRPRGFAARPGGRAYPGPIEHCEVCRWREHCDEKRRADDHMSLVAGISKSQIGELEGEASTP